MLFHYAIASLNVKTKVGIVKKDIFSRTLESSEFTPHENKNSKLSKWFNTQFVCLSSSKWSSSLFVRPLTQ